MTTRTKWMRLSVRDPADVLRWAGQQNARQLDEFRHRVVGGREFFTFRMVPRYPIQIGTCDIIVVAHAADNAARRLIVGARAAGRRAARNVAAVAARLTARRPAVPAATAELYRLPAPRRSLTTSR